MKKPVGIILSAVVLSLVGIFCLLMSALMVFAGIGGDHPVSTPMPHFYTFLLVGMAVFYFCIALWMALTAYGILRLRRWARYSILIISGCIAFFSLMSALGIAVSYFAMPQQPNVDPHILSIVFFAIVLFELTFTAIGTGLFIYFIRRPTRELFEAANPAILQSYPAPEPNPTPDGTFQAPPPPYPTVPHKTYTGFFSSPEHAPAAIKVLGWIFLVSTLFILPWSFAPFPGFIFGQIIPPGESHLMFLAFGILSACMGYGLLKLKNWAWLTSIALIAVGFINYVMCLLPQSQNQLRAYMLAFTNYIPTLPGQPRYVYTYPTSMIIMSMSIGVAVNIAFLWLLLHYRTAFTTPSQSQPESV